MTLLSGRSRATVGVVAVILTVWIAAAIVLFGLRYWSAHDESVYVAKALGGRDPFIWRPHRALGVPALLSPVTGLGFGVTASRVVMLVFNMTAIGVGLALWTRLLGRWVAVGPAALLLSWLGLTYSSAILPNLPTATTLFATLPALWLAVTHPTRISQTLTLTGFVLIGLFRPTALVWITLGIVAATLIDPAVRRHWRPLALLIGIALPSGLLIWSIESYLTFGVNPLERVLDARGAISSYEHDNVVLTLLGNVAHPSGSDLMSLVVLSAALGASAVLTIVALASTNPSTRGVLTLATCVGGAKLLAYVIFPSDGSARFLLTGLLCSSVGLGVGLRTIIAGRTWATGAIAVMMAFALVWQVGVAREHAQAVLRSRNAMAVAVAHMRTISGDATCYYESNVSFPSFYVGTSCGGVRAVEPVQSMQRMEGRRGTVHSFLVWRGEIELRPGWSDVDFGTDAQWRLYHHSNVGGP